MFEHTHNFPFLIAKGVGPFLINTFSTARYLIINDGTIRPIIGVLFYATFLGMLLSRDQFD